MVQTAETDGTLADLEAKAATLQSQLVRTQESLHAVRFQIGIIKNSRAPIYSLPHEILEDILYRCHLDDLDVRKRIRDAMCEDEDSTGTENLPFSVFASHVSRRWRDIAIDSARLWTTIDLVSFQPEYLLQLYLERSKGRSLNIILYDAASYLPDDDDRFPADAVPCFIPLLPHLGRCRSILIRASEYNFIFDIVPHLHNIAVPRLEHFEVEIDGSSFEGDYDRRFDAGPNIFTSGAPNLTSFELFGISLHSCWPPLSSLTDIILDDGVRSHCMNYDVLCSFLIAAVSVTRLVFKGRVLAFDDDEAIVEIEVPSVLTLCILGRDVDFLSYSIGPTVFTPSLQALYMEQMGSSIFHTFVIRLEKQTTGARYPRLQSLHLIDIEHDRFYMADLMSATPNINHLALLDRSIPHYARVVFNFIRDYDMGQISTTGSLWPHLHTITTTVVDIQLLREVVSGRIAGGCPLRKLTLPLELPACEAAWFSERLELETLGRKDMLAASSF
jgi:hypothetical protein